MNKQISIKEVADIIHSFGDHNSVFDIHLHLLNSGKFTIFADTEEIADEIKSKMEIFEGISVKITETLKSEENSVINVLRSHSHDVLILIDKDKMLKYE